MAEKEKKEKNIDSKRVPGLSTYCVGNIGYEMYYMSNDNYGNFFFTEIAGISPILTGTIITIASAIKAVLSPISGMIIDAAPFKKFFKDKHTPWVLIMSVVIAVLYVLMTWTGVKHMNAMIVGTIFAVFLTLGVFLQNGYRSAIPSMATGQGESTFLASGVQLASNIGRVLVGAMFPLIAVKMSQTGGGKSIDGTGFLWATIAVSLGGILVYWISAIGIKKSIRADRLTSNVKEEKKKEEVNKPTTMQLIKQVVTEPLILVPFIIGCGLFFRSFATGPIAPYYFKYIAENEMMTAAFSTSTSIMGLLSVVAAPLMLAFIFKNNLRVTLITSIAICIAAHISVVFTGQNPIAFIVAMCVATFFYQATSVLLFAAFVNAIDVVELRNRREGKTDIASGTAMSLHFTAVMLAQVFAVFLRNFGLNLIGYTGADTAITPAFQGGLLKLLAFMPAAIMCVALIAALFYKLTPETMVKVRAELAELRKEQAE